MIRNILFQVHWLIGITAGVVLGVVGASGAALSFEDELLMALNRGIVTVVPHAESPLAVTELVHRITAENAGRRLLSITVYAANDRAARVTFAAAASQSAVPPNPGATARRGEVRYVDPYTGRLLGVKALRGESTLHLLEQVHRNLAAGPGGKLIVGSSTLALVLLCLSGLYLRWPAHVFDWRQWLHVDFALGGRTFWRRLHMVVGTVTLALYLCAALTGLYFAFGWYREAILTVTGASAPQRGAAKLAQPAPAPSNASVIWTAFERSGARYSLVTLNLPQAPDQAAELRYLAPDAPHERAFNRLTIHPLTGEVLARQLYAQQSFGNRAVTGMFPLHSGRLLGVTGTLLMMLASLAMPFFVITGWYLYLKRRRRAQVAAEAGVHAS